MTYSMQLKQRELYHSSKIKAENEERRKRREKSEIY
jgi:hypothetical protein